MTKVVNKGLKRMNWCKRLSSGVRATLVKLFTRGERRTLSFTFPTECQTPANLWQSVLNVIDYYIRPPVEALWLGRISSRELVHRSSSSKFSKFVTRINLHVKCVWYYFAAAFWSVSMPFCCSLFVLFNAILLQPFYPFLRHFAAAFLSYSTPFCCSLFVLFNAILQQPCLDNTMK